MTTTATTSGATRASAASPGPSSTTAKPDSLAAALAILQTRLPHIAKDKSADIKPGFSYRYADLAVISKQLLPVMGDLGLSFSCAPTIADEGRLVLDYVLRHTSGESAGGLYPLPQTGTPQQIGSAITYARRYCLCAITGVAADEDDDDAAEAETAAKPKRAARVQAARAQRNRAPETHPDGSATQAELARMTFGPEPGAWRSDGTAENDPFYDQPPGDLPAAYPPGERQFRALAMHFKRLGYEDGDEQAREERLRFTAVLAGAGEIASSRDLTQEQVKLALGRLGKLRDRTALIDAVEELRQSEGAGV